LTSPEQTILGILNQLTTHSQRRQVQLWLKRAFLFLPVAFCVSFFLSLPVAQNTSRQPFSQAESLYPLPFQGSPNRKTENCAKAYFTSALAKLKFHRLKKWENTDESVLLASTAEQKKTEVELAKTEPESTI